MRWIGYKVRSGTAEPGTKSPETPPKPIWLQAYEATVPLVQALVWPVVLLFFVFELREPLRKMADTLPKKLEQATKVSAGSSGLVIEIEKSAQAAGNPKLSALLTGLSSGALRLFLQIPEPPGGNGTISTVDNPQNRVLYARPAGPELDAIHELQNKGLIEFSRSPEDLEKIWNGLLTQTPQGFWVPRDGSSRLSEEQWQEVYRAGQYRMSPQGKEARDLLQSTVIKELSEE